MKPHFLNQPDAVSSFSFFQMRIKCKFELQLIDKKKKRKKEGTNRIKNENLPTVMSAGPHLEPRMIKIEFKLMPLRKTRCS